MVEIECDDVAFECHFKKVHTRNCSFRKKIFCKQGGKLDYSKYSQVSLLTLCYHWQILSNSFVLEMMIAKDHYLSCNTLYTFFIIDASIKLFEPFLLLEIWS